MVSQTFFQELHKDKSYYEDKVLKIKVYYDENSSLYYCFNEDKIMYYDENEKRFVELDLYYDYSKQQNVKGLMSKMYPEDEANLESDKNVVYYKKILETINVSAQVNIPNKDDLYAYQRLSIKVDPKANEALQTLKNRYLEAYCFNIMLLNQAQKKLHK